MQNREQGTSMFRSRTQEVVGVVEAVRLWFRIFLFVDSPLN